MMVRIFFLILFGLAGMIRAAEWAESYEILSDILLEKTA